MKETGYRVFNPVYPTNCTLGTTLNAYSSLHSVSLGKQFHAYIIKYQIDFETSVGNATCSFYSKPHNLESAIRAFQGIREKNVISWTAMLTKDVKPNELTLTSVLSLCCTTLSFGAGAQIHSFSSELGYESYLHIKNSIIYLYLKCGWIREAQKLFDGMETAVSLVTWNAMIAGHAQAMDFVGDDHSAHKSGYEALRIFLKLNCSGMKPDLFTFSSILTVCSRLVAQEQGEQIHAQTIKTGFLTDMVVGTALINMYNKCGSIEKASKSFVEMDTRTMISWTSLITALQLFEDMRLAGVRPDHITFVGVLSACSQAGMVNEALIYFEMMQKEYKIKPVTDHFACLVDMFKMDFEPTEFIWSRLIAGCQSHGNLELGFYTAEQLLELKPKDTETYVLLLSMYLSVGRWKDVSRVRKMMREKKVGKLQDWSWINIKDRVYSFKPKDKSHFHSADIYKSLESLLQQANSLGYESLQTSEVTNEIEEKISSSTAYHSEKLAIAFGLLNTPNDAPIHVIKSVFMCKDCHNFVKHISLLTTR
ncbi:hypothetical protein I3842_08G058700 [Carya illinoinensis]|uniref:DYW domain-containing protein n=1 Tax=Carya illinoinensis TaxID=32201 RepID=A0A922E9U8_CARIL|nr:hypothetical protein I3842_08G058700 [Carya illinoinensis]